MNRTSETIDNRFWAHFATHIRKITMASRISNIFYAILGLSTAVVDFLDVPYGNLRLLRTKAAEVLRYLVLIDIAKGGNCTVDYNPVPLHHRPSTKHLLYNLSAISLVGQMHRENGIDVEHSQANEVNEKLSAALTKMLQLLPVYTGCTLKELAMIQQSESDPASYQLETREGRGLDYLLSQ